ncbi:alpha/beta hydrolase family protein [Haloarchaeobius amylolyticus]|uniref:alpha/beta hydrolase family protein n=1 Tax=Haloarchaeobius amylolyticus TaxID=1198296 RepID=UPI002271463C|nr:acyl-CoA thioester hydrolase/BAAT C-terminal domain-containing protein [Haloarchaeobius amylolyticus]
MPELSLPEETRVGDPLPVRLSGGPAMAEVSVRLTVTDDAGRELTVQSVYRTTTDGDLDTTKANVVEGPDIGGAMPLSHARPEAAHQFPYAVFDEAKKTPVVVSAKVDGEVSRQDTIRAFVEPTVRTEPVGDAAAFDGEVFVPPGDGPHPGVVFLPPEDATTHRRQVAMLATAGVAVVVPRYRASSAGDDEVRCSPVEGAVDLLASREDVDAPVSIVGVGRGTEAATLVAADHDAVDTVVGYAPTAYAFSGIVGADSSVDPLPVADDAADAEPTASRFQRAVDDASFDAMEAAGLPWADVAHVTLVSGGHDTVWPATAFCERIAMWRDRAGRDTVQVDHPDAGHGIREPYHDYREREAGLGGSALGDAEVAIDACPAVLEAVRGDD